MEFNEFVEKVNELTAENSDLPLGFATEMVAKRCLKSAGFIAFSQNASDSGKNISKEFFEVGKAFTGHIALSKEFNNNTSELVQVDFYDEQANTTYTADLRGKTVLEFKSETLDAVEWKDLKSVIFKAKDSYYPAIIDAPVPA